MPTNLDMLMPRDMAFIRFNKYSTFVRVPQWNHGDSMFLESGMQQQESDNCSSALTKL